MKFVEVFTIFVICAFILTALTNNSFREHSQAGDNPAVHSARAESLPPVVSIVEPTVATFSIVAFDPNTKELGIAVQSKVVAVGSILCYDCTFI